MKPDTAALERAAANGGNLDGELCLPDMWLFLAFRELYRQFRAGALGKEQAAKEKRELLAKHELARFYYDSYAATVELRGRIASRLVELERCGCGHCRELIRLFDGRGEEHDGTGEENADQQREDGLGDAAGGV